MPVDEKVKLLQAKAKPSIDSAIFQSVMIGTPRAAITFCFGHPFDLLKTRMQADLKIPSATVLAKNIAQKESFAGFFVGGKPNFARHIFKTAYRDPVRGASTAIYKKYFPESNKATIATAATFTMATFDTFAMAPLEKCKVSFMTTTDPDAKSIGKYIGVRPEGFISAAEYFYRGAAVSWIRSTISWGTYLVPESMVRQRVIDASPRVTQKNTAHPQIPLPELVCIGASCGAINAVCMLPFDAVKTNVQMNGYKGKATVKEMLGVAGTLLAKRGFTGLYRGIGPRLLHYSIVGILTEGVMQEVDKVWSQTIPKLR